MHPTAFYCPNQHRLTWFRQAFRLASSASYPPQSPRVDHLNTDG
ncbi:Uncharacterised protein [Vibrio cholerae]|nr:Uncharacterised protein [Vibrio cholerae]